MGGGSGCHSLGAGEPIPVGALLQRTGKGQDSDVPRSTNLAMAREAMMSSRWGDLATEPVSGEMPAVPDAGDSVREPLSILSLHLATATGWTLVDLPLSREEVLPGTEDLVSGTRLIATHEDLQLLGGEVQVGRDPREVALRVARKTPATPWIVLDAARVEFWGAVCLGEEVTAVPLREDLGALPEGEIGPGLVEALTVRLPDRAWRRPARILVAFQRYLRETEKAERLGMDGACRKLLDDDQYLSLCVLGRDRLPFTDTDPVLERIARHPLRQSGDRNKKVRVVPAEEQDGFLRDRAEVARINLRLGLWAAKRYERYCRSLELRDLLHETTLGLLRAAELFRPEKGTRFSTFATHWVRQKIRRALENRDRFIRIPHHRRKDPSLPSGVTRRPVSLDALPPGVAEEALGISHDPDADPVGRTVARERRLRILRAVRTLPYRARIVVLRRFGLLEGLPRLSLEALGERFGVTRERIRQIETKALKKLASRLGTSGSPFFVEAA